MSLMMRFLIYLFPMLINFIIGGTFFICAYRLSKAGIDPMWVGAILAAWAISYAVSSLLVGKFTNEKNAAKLVITGAVSIAAVSLCFLLFDGLYMQYLWIFLIGICFAFYCTPFQVFSKSIETDGGKTDPKTGTVRSAALYTASWSLGMAIGPFIFGILSPEIGYSLNTFFGLFIAVCLYLIHRSVSKKALLPERKEIASSPAENDLPATAEKTLPDMVLAGWMMGMAASISVTIARTMIPNRAVLLEFSKSDAGMILFVLGVVQMFCGGICYWSRKWMYRSVPVLLLAFCGALSVLFFAFGNNRILFFTGAVIYGIFAGSSYFALVYHSLIHPTKNAKYVAVNEALVGISNITAPVLAGYLNSATGFSGSGFLLACGMILLLQGFAAFHLFRYRREL